jgi:hypothetical protein
LPKTLPNPFLDYYRCPVPFADFRVRGELAREVGYFTFRDAICYGRKRGAAGVRSLTPDLPDASLDVAVGGGQVRLPFDFSEIVANLREERYQQTSRTAVNRLATSGASRNIYYLARPFMPVSVRRHLQRVHLNGWHKIAFPRWPVDLTIEGLMRTAMKLVLESSGQRSIPFIWFWPEGAPGAAIVTHDVESPSGVEFCAQLMDIDDSFEIKSAFQVVPEVRYESSKRIVGGLRRRSFEVNVHDLNHDGHLFRSRRQFVERAARINRYVQEFGSRGFRSGGMYRQLAWLSLLEVSFDMSVPNIAHLEPQRGGCCTVMPYFVGNILELPLTTTQDYSLFHIVGDYSIELWKKQIELILSQNGLVSLLAHPDYLIEKRARAVYLDLLAHVSQLRERRQLWIALPGDVDRWWRSRNNMVLVRCGDSWRIEGADSHRARVAYATLENDRLVYEFGT